MRKKIYEFITKHWILSTILSSSPAIMFSIIELMGIQLNLVNSDGTMKTLTIIIFWVSIIISIFFNLFKAYQSNKNDIQNINGHKLLQKVISSTNSIFEKKIDNLKDYIDDFYDKNFCKNPYWIINQPKYNIKSIIDEINVCLSDVIGIKRECIGVSLIHKFSTDNVWKRDFSKNLSGTEIEELIKDPNSTINYMFNNKKDRVFEADKFIAERNGHYILSKRDRSSETPGSIMLYDISYCTNGKKYILAALCITTYGIKICNQNDNEILEKLNIIIEPFKTKLNLELLNLFIREGHSNNINKKEKATA